MTIPNRPLRPCAVFTAVGLILWAAAGLKLLSAGGGTPAAVGWAEPGWVNLAAVQFEFLLGVWLLSGRNRPAAWLVAVVTFTGFAAVSAWGGYVGQTSCGCFGAVPLRPWWAFGLDAAVLLALLTAGRPGAADGAAPGTAARPAAAFLLNVGLALGCWTAVVAATLGTTDAAVAYVRGDRVFVRLATVEYGAIPAGGTGAARVEVVNLTAGAVRVVGGTSDCSCTAVADLPAEVPAGGSVVVAVRLKAPDTAGNFSRTAWLWTDAPGHRSLPLLLVARSVGE